MYLYKRVLEPYFFFIVLNYFLYLIFEFLLLQIIYIYIYIFCFWLFWK